MDNFKVKLLAKTVPVDPEYGRSMSEFISYVARVSNPGNQWNFETAQKLLDWLMNEKHWSPYEMGNMVFEIRTSRAIGRQIMRHSPKIQEFSQRYCSEMEFLRPIRARLQDHKNRQNSLDEAPEGLVDWWYETQETIIALVEERYNLAIELGIAKECARNILPEGLTFTTLYLNGNLRDWMHYIAARKDAGSQKEHRDIALALQEIFEKEMGF